MEAPPGAGEPGRKQSIRSLALAARKNQPHKDEISRRIVARCLAHPAYGSARTVMWYIDVRSEVRTRFDLPSALECGRRVVVPWCNDREELELFLLESMDDLAPGKFGVLEPRTELRGLSRRRVDPTELDFVIVPGVAFDRRGGRLGHGAGYYDRLLSRVRSDAVLVGLAFECQMVEQTPLGPHDVPMDNVVTQTALYTGVGRERRPSPSL